MSFFRFACLVLLAGYLLLLPAGAMASGNEAFSFSFRSRALIDASFSGYGTDDVCGYYRLEDFRVGYKAGFSGFGMKADIGYGGGKVAVKDLLLSYRFGNSTVVAGNGYEPFSMDMLISTSDLRFHQSASSVLAFTGSRKLGVTYHFHLPSVYLAAGVYTHNDINKLGDGRRNSHVFTCRGVWRNLSSDRRLFHFGGAFSFRTREYGATEPYSAVVSSVGITSLFGENAVEAVVNNAGMELKGLIEFLFSGRKFIFQGEYFADSFESLDDNRYILFHGGYVQAGFLLYGEFFSYDSDYAVPSRPVSDRALELVARINYTDLDDGRTGVYGGVESDCSLGLNFYLNRYFAVKLNFGALFPNDNGNPFYSSPLFMGQLRLQYVF